MPREDTTDRKGAPESASAASPPVEPVRPKDSAYEYETPDERLERYYVAASREEEEQRYQAHLAAAERQTDHEE